jgi:hypothetical protein
MPKSAVKVYLDPYSARERERELEGLLTIIGVILHYGLLDTLRAHDCAQMRPSIGS